MNFVRHLCTALYRTAALALLLVIAAELSETNKYIFIIAKMVYKVLGGSGT